jgi:hypothetical protein
MDHDHHDDSHHDGSYHDGSHDDGSHDDGSHDQHHGHSQDDSQGGGSSIVQDLLEKGPHLLQELEDFFNHQHGGGEHGKGQPLSLMAAFLRVDNLLTNVADLGGEDDQYEGADDEGYGHGHGHGGYGEDYGGDHHGGHGGHDEHGGHGGHGGYGGDEGGEDDGSY